MKAEVFVFNVIAHTTKAPSSVSAPLISLVFVPLSSYKSKNFHVEAQYLSSISSISRTSQDMHANQMRRKRCSISGMKSIGNGDEVDGFSVQVSREFEDAFKAAVR